MDSSYIFDVDDDPLARIASTVERLDRSIAEGATMPDPAQIGHAVTVAASSSDGPDPTAPRHEAPPSPPRYERTGLLGEGGMGRVERARDRDLLREVAVKVLHPDLRHDARLLRQFLWEARVTAYLDHPNIVPVHDLGVGADGEPFFTMKLVRGRSLEDILERLAKDDPATSSAFPLTRRLRIFIQLCHAVAFAHARGVLHRDLKPANVMVGEYGEVLVSDWGIAVPLPDDAGQALRTMLQGAVGTGSAGTPQYMSPEQAKGDPLDARSDVYALGAILYELVALRAAVAPGSLAEVLARVTRGEIVPLHEAAPSAPSGLVAIVAKALAVDRDERYAAASDLVDELETFLDGRTPRAEDASVARQLGRFYFAHDPAMKRLRVVDIDAWAGGAFLVGLGISALVGARLGPWGWPLIACGVLASIPTTLRWLRFRRHARARQRSA